MPSTFKCPYCPVTFPLTNDTYRKSSLSRYGNSSASPYDSQICIVFFECPSCGKISISVHGEGKDVKSINTFIQPMSLATQFPNYVPQQIRSDYEEAYSIVSLSPKASATLSRRCIQSMIRDFWGIKKSKLVDEIVALAENDKVPAEQRKILHALRNIGNIGAHPEVDINLIIDIQPDDAKKLLKVIELLIKQWYIERHEQTALYDDILAVADDVVAQKKKN